MTPSEARKDEVLWTGRMKNWRTGEDSDPIPPQHASREIRVTKPPAWGGLSLVFDEPFGECEVHVELDNDGVHVRIYTPDAPGGEPVLSAALRPSGLAVDTIHQVKEST